MPKKYPLQVLLTGAMLCIHREQQHVTVSLKTCPREASDYCGTEFLLLQDGDDSNSTYDKIAGRTKKDDTQCLTQTK